MKEYLKKVCHDCGAKEGEIHQLHCDMERCPSCGEQAITCYKHCYNSDGSSRKSFVEGKRIPYIITPNYCRRCLKPYPDMFMVSKEEWKKVIPLKLRKFIFCKDCYSQIKRWMKCLS